MATRPDLSGSDRSRRRVRVLVGVGFVLAAGVLAAFSSPLVAVQSDYIVQVSYDSSISFAFHQVDVLLYSDTDRSCADLVADQVDPPSEDKAYLSLTLIPNAQGAFPDTLVNVPEDVELLYAVARGEPSDGNGSGVGYFVTFGCQDMIDPPGGTGAVLIDIDMDPMNWRAQDDSYVGYQDSVLSVGDPGVLSNDDTLPDGTRLTALYRPDVVSPPYGEPSHGSVALAETGGFVYTPDPGYAGSDSFEYRATDGYIFTVGPMSETSTVSIEILETPLIRPFGAVVLEGDTGSQTANVVVYLENAAGEPYEAPDTVTVDWTTVDEYPNPAVAQADSDFVPASGTLTFDPGDTEATVPIEILGDTIIEPPLLYGEWALVAFSNPSANARIWPDFFGLGVVIIIDDD